MTQAGRQGSPRNSSGRTSAGQQSARTQGAGGAGRGQRDFSKGGFSGGADRGFKRPKPREEAFVDPDLNPGGGAPDQADRKAGAKPAARKPAARKPGAGKVPGTPGALKPKPRVGAGA